MELYLIRHGQSFNNTLPDGDGRVEPRRVDRKTIPLAERPVPGGTERRPWIDQREVDVEKDRFRGHCTSHDSS